MSIDAKLIGKFINQKVTAAMAEKTKQCEKKIKKLEKGGRDRVSGDSSSKNGTRGGGRAFQEKENIQDSNEYQFKTTSEVFVLIGTKPKEHPLKLLKGKIPTSRLCQQRYAIKKAARSKNASTSTLQTSKTDSAKMFSI